MANIKGRLVMSNIANLITLPLFLSAIIVEIIDIIKNPNSVYQNIWGIFRYFSYDGSILSFIISIIMFINYYKALKLQIDDETFRDKALSQYIYIISLISACNEIIIFLTAIILIFYPISSAVWHEEFKSSYKTIVIHEFIPFIIIVRFIVFDTRKRDLKLYEKFIGGLFISVYLSIILSLCGGKVFTSFDKTEGDGKIPYPFFDFYHEPWYVCLSISLFLIAFGIGFGVLLDFLNKKVERSFLLREQRRKEEEERLARENQRLFVESAAQEY